MRSSDCCLIIQMRPVYIYLILLQNLRLCLDIETSLENIIVD